MTFLEHLDELRTRLIRILIASVIGVGIALPFRKSLYNLLLTPQNMRVQNMLAEVLGWLRDLGLRPSLTGFMELWLRAQASDETPFVPNFRSPMEPFTALFKICLLAGLLLASPYILYQIWSFIVPALKHTERRTAIRLGSVLGVFFLLGAAFAFFVAAPLLMEMSANLWRSAEIHLQPANLWTFNDYLGFLMQLILAFGISFELPLMMAFLARIDLIPVSLFREKRRIAFFVLVTVAAVLTPGDIVPMLMMAVPLIGLYEFGILLASIAARRRHDELELPAYDGDS